MEVLANAVVVTILQYISGSNQHVVHLKLTQCCVSIIARKSWERRIKAFHMTFQRSSLYFIDSCGLPLELLYPVRR